MNIRKKIAVVVVSALAFAGFSSVSAQAAPTAAYTTMYDTTNGVQVVNGYATLTLTTETSTVVNVSTSGVGSIVSAASGTNDTMTVAPVAGGNWYQLTTGSAGVGTSTLILTSAVVGTSIVSITPLNTNGSPGTTVVKTVTWTSTGSLAASTAYTTVYSASGATVPSATTDAVAIVAPMTSNALAANIKVDLRDGNNVAIANGTITATVTGAGLIGTGSTQSGATMQGRAVTGASGAYFINVFGDGTPGTSVITIYSGSTLLATKTFTFSGTATSYSAVKAGSVLKVGANADAIAVTVKDAAGNLVADGTTVYATSDATAVATIAASAVTSAGIATFAIQGNSLGAANITFANAITSPTITSISAVRVGSSTVSSVSLSFDNATYVNGGVVVLTLSAKDAAGLPVADGTYTNLLSTDLVSSTQLGGVTLTGSVSPALVNGVKTWNLYAPLSAGPFSVNGIVALTKAVLSTSASVADTNATSLSKLIDSVNALNTTLIAQITDLRSQIDAIKAQSVLDKAAAVAADAKAKADYNKLASAWNKAHPKAKVALKK